MSIGIYTSYENGWLDDFDPDLGVLLLRNIEALDQIATEKGVKPLAEFDAYSKLPLPPDFDGNTDVLDELQAEAQIEWHDPWEAIMTLECLLAALRANSTRLGDAAKTQDVISDLLDLSMCLKEAVRQGTRFHFQVG